MRHVLLAVLVVLALAGPARAEESRIVTELPTVGPQVFPWPLRGDIGDCYQDPEGAVWLPTSLGEVARLDWKRARANPRDPAAWTVYDLGADLCLMGAAGYGGKVWIVGRTAGAGGVVSRGVVFEWSGSVWRGVYLGDRARVGQLCGAIALSPSETYASGWTESGGTVLLHRDATGWHEEGGGEARDLYQFLRLSNGDLAASGSLGRIYRLTEGGWRLHRQLPVRDPILGFASWKGKILASCASGVYLVGEDVEDLSDAQATRGAQSVAGAGDAVYTVDYDAVLRRRVGGAWQAIEPDRLLAIPFPAFTRVRLTSLDDTTVLGVGTRGMVFLLSASERTDLSFGWRAAGDLVSCVPRDAPFAVAATPPMWRPVRLGGVVDPGYVITANAKRVRVLLAPTTEEPGAVFARTEDEIYLLTKGGLVHRFDGTRWEILTPERLRPDWSRLGLQADRRHVPALSFDVIHAPEPGLVYVANPLFRLHGGAWTQVDLPKHLHVREIPREHGRHPPGPGLRGGRQPQWDWPKITAIRGSAADMRLETTLYPLRYDGTTIEPIPGPANLDVDPQGLPTNPFYVDRTKPSGNWLRIRR